MEEIRVLSPQGLLGYGFPVPSFEEGMRRKPHMIAVDGGSTDPGPYYLGAGVSFTDRAAVKRDLEIMLRGALGAGIPLIIGSSGGSGGKPHLKWTVDIIREIAREQNYHFKMAVIDAEMDKGFLIDQLGRGNVHVFESRRPLTAGDIERSTRVVGQMGVQPFIKALDAGAQLVVAGRAYDPACFAAFPIKKGFDPGLTLHMSKILECGAICAVPGSASDCILGTVRKDHFIVEPMNPDRKCTEVSVAAHTLYEKSDPQFLPGPDGTLDLTGVVFQQLGQGSVKVTGSKFTRASPRTVKLEGAALVGYRTISIAGARCPTMIADIDRIIEEVNQRVREVCSHIPSEDYRVLYHIYGKDGVMGVLEPQKEITSQELGIVIEVVAKTQELANTVCSVTRSIMLHHGYPGRMATAGNLAFLFSPSDLKAGEVYEFSVYHLLETDDPLGLFPVKIEEL